MSNIIGILDYGIAGNISNIQRVVKKAGGECLIIKSINQLSNVDKIILPGVGSFKDAIKELENKQFISYLQKETKPILGICLGMQILTQYGVEYGKTKGLQLIDSSTISLEVDVITPHVGFNDIQLSKKSILFNNISKLEFYFMHSYIIEQSKYAISSTTYANKQFVSSIQKDHIYGVQFHPEKSRESGIQLIKNFINLG